MKSFIFTLALSILYFSVNAQEVAKKSRKECKNEKLAEQTEKVSKLIESKTFVFSARSVVPQCGDPVSLEEFFSLNINGGIISSYLPFYGFESDYKIENSPLIFTRPYENYSEKQEKDKYIIGFNAMGENDNMKFYFRISELGYTYLKVSSEQRQSISFLGIIDEVEPAVFSSK